MDVGARLNERRVIKIWPRLILLHFCIITTGASCRWPLWFGSSRPPIEPIRDAALVTDFVPYEGKGKLIYDLPNGKLWSLALTRNAEPTLLFRLPPGSFAFQPVWSQATQHIAYGLIQADAAGGGMSSARIWVATIDGSGARPVTQPPPTFAGTYRDPTWSLDGKTMWVTVQLPEKDAEGVVRLRSEIRRIDVATGAETLVFSNARGPAVSPDNRRLAYLSQDANSSRTAIWIAQTDGSDAQMLVTADKFEEVYVPMRFSPDGQTLAFAAADAITQLQRTPRPEAIDTRKKVFAGAWPCACPGRPQGYAPTENHYLKIYRSWLHWPVVRLSWPFYPTSVHAHGLYPADIWLVDMNTGELTRLTELAEDHPTPVWSSDGRFLAFSGVLGIYVIELAERHAIRIIEPGIDGQLEWIDP